MCVGCAFCLCTADRNSGCKGIESVGAAKPCRSELSVGGATSNDPKNKETIIIAEFMIPISSSPVCLKSIEAISPTSLRILHRDSSQSKPIVGSKCRNVCSLKRIQVRALWQMISIRRKVFSCFRKAVHGPFRCNGFTRSDLPGD